MLSSTQSSPVHSRRPSGPLSTNAQQPREAASQEAPSASNDARTERCVRNSSDVLDLSLERDLGACSLQLQMTGLVDTTDIASLTVLLAREDVQLGTLELNLSSGTDPVQLGALLVTLRKHPELQSVRFRVDGSEKGPFPNGLREALARSKDCLIKGGVALRDALFRQLDDRLNSAIKDTTALWAVAATLDDFRSMRLDDASSGLSALSARYLSSFADLLQDEALRLAVAALRS